MLVLWEVGKVEGINCCVEKYSFLFNFKRLGQDFMWEPWTILSDWIFERWGGILIEKDFQNIRLDKINVVGVWWMKIKWENNLLIFNRCQVLHYKWLILFNAWKCWLRKSVVNIKFDKWWDSLPKQVSEIIFEKF